MPLYGVIYDSTAIKCKYNLDPMRKYIYYYTSASQTTLREKKTHLFRVQGGQSPACMPGHLCLLLHSWTWWCQ